MTSILSKKLKQLMTICALSLMLLVFYHQTAAQYATGGSGIYRNNIHWFVWGAEGETLIPGTSRTYTLTSGSFTFTTTCTISSFSPNATFYAYRPGSWQGDGFDNLYNIGGANSSNTLVNAISVPEAATYSLRFTCSSTLNGNSYTLPGIVFADAEQSEGRSGEFIQGNAVSGGTWRIIDRFRNCSSSQIGLLTGTTLRISGVTPTCNDGPTNIAYLDGGSSIEATIKGGGVSAVAIGVFINQDFGDAPASYGTALHLNNPVWSGGTLTDGTNTNINDSDFTLGTIGTPALRLGSTVDYETASQPNAAATGDDLQDADDEDGVTLPASILQGSHISVPVAVNGNGRLNAWFDWNHDSDFDDPGERAAADQAVSTGTVNLNIIVPANTGVGTSYARFRLCSSAGVCNTPSGIAVGGEVEDYSFVNPSPPNISLLKSCPAPANCTTAPQLPGTDLTYKIAFTNTGGKNAANLIILDAIPEHTDYKIDSTITNAEAAGLTLAIEYSSDYNPLNPAAATWNYTPVSGGGGASAGYDRLVKAVRWRVTAGVLSNISPVNTGDVSFTARIR